MSPAALALALTAAVLHATWNALVKSSGDRAVTIAAVSAVHIVFGIVLVALYPLPLAKAWPFLLASTIIHYGYYAFLVYAYGKGDLSQVYPISRGISPVLVSIGGVLWAGDTLSGVDWGAILLISFAIALLALPGRRRATDGRTVLAALATGLLIASYSIADGLGVRSAGTAMSYIGWLFLLEAPVVAYVLAIRRRQWAEGGPGVIAMGLLGGVFSTLAYSLVLYAKTFSPLGAVSAVRESSVIVAALIGAVLFGERPWMLRVAAALLVVAGVVLLALQL